MSSIDAVRKLTIIYEELDVQKQPLLDECGDDKKCRQKIIDAVAEVEVLLQEAINQGITPNDPLVAELNRVAINAESQIRDALQDMIEAVEQVEAVAKTLQAIPFAFSLVGL